MTRISTTQLLMGMANPFGSNIQGCMDRSGLVFALSSLWISSFVEWPAAGNLGAARRLDGRRRP
jgi:hypothetical protein